MTKQDIIRSFREKFAPNDIVPHWDENDEVSYPDAESFLLESIDTAVEVRNKEIRDEVTKYVQEAIKDPKSGNYIYADMIPLTRLDGILNR